MAKKLPPGWNRTNLTPAEVRLILRIHWTDRAERKARGIGRGTPGLRGRLAKQFGTSPEVIKKIVAMRPHVRCRRDRFPGIAIPSIRREVEKHLEKYHGEPQ